MKQNKKISNVIVIIAVTINVAVLLFGVTPDPPTNLTQLSEHTNIDNGMQKVISEELLKQLEITDAKSGLGIIMDNSSGKIISAIGYNNKNIDMTILGNAYEPGSVIKALLIGAALNENSTTLDTIYEYEDWIRYDNNTITNALNPQKSLLSTQEILNYSVNTGAVKILNELASEKKDIWRNYLNQYYGFGTATKYGLPYGQKGYIPQFDKTSDPNWRHDISSFGLGMTATPQQLVAAFASINTATYLPSPDADNTNQVRGAVQKPIHKLTSQTKDKLSFALSETYKFNNPTMDFGPTITIGGKSGTAPIAQIDGTYIKNRDYGTYVGFINSGSTSVTMLIRIDEPITSRFASREANDAWNNTVTRMLTAGLIR